MNLKLYAPGCLQAMTFSKFLSVASSKKLHSQVCEYSFSIIFYQVDSRSVIDGKVA